MNGVEIHYEALEAKNECLEECRRKYELLVKQWENRGWVEVPGYEDIDFLTYLEEEFNLTWYKLKLNEKVYKNYLQEVIKHGYFIVYEVVRIVSRARKYKEEEKISAVFQELDEAKNLKRKHEIIQRLKEGLGETKDRPSWKTEAILLDKEVKRLKEENKKIKKENKELKERVKYAEEHRRKVVQQLSHQF